MTTQTTGTTDTTGTATAGDLGGRVRRGALWSAVNSVGLRLCNIVITAVVAHVVTPDEFGVFAAALTVAMILGSFADWGVSAYLMRGDVDRDRVAPTVSLIAVTSGVGLALATVVAAPVLADAFAAPAATGPIRLMAVCLVISGVAAVPTALLAREFAQGRLLVANLVSFVPANLVLLVLAFAGSGAWAFAWSRVAAVLVQAVVVIAFVGALYRPRLDREALREVLRFGVPLAGANLVNYVLVNADFALVGHRLGPALLGIYVLAFNVASWPTAVLSAAINSVAMPAFSRVGNADDALVAALATSLRLVCLLAFPFAAMLIALATPFVEVVYGGQWAESAAVLRILALYGATFVVISLVSNLLVGKGRSRQVLGIQLVWIGALAPAMLLAVGDGGAVGVAWAHVAVAVVVVLPLYAWIAGRFVPGLLRLLVRSAARPFLASVGCAAVASGASRLVDAPLAGLLLGGVSGATCYLLCVRRSALEYLPALRRTRAVPS